MNFVDKDEIKISPVQTTGLIRFEPNQSGLRCEGDGYEPLEISFGDSSWDADIVNNDYPLTFGPEVAIYDYSHAKCAWTSFEEIEPQVWNTGIYADTNDKYQ